MKQIRNGLKSKSGQAGTNIESASAHNRRVILQSIRLYGPLSRPQLVQLSGLSFQTVSSITSDLRERGLVMKSGQRKGSRGQPATELSLDPDGGLTFGVSIGADHIITVLVDLAGQVRGRVEHVLMHPTLTKAYELIADATQSLTKQHAHDPERVLGLGVAVPGRFTTERSELIPPPYLESWTSANIPQELGEACGLRTWVENDANTAALGESYYGAGRQISDFLYVYIGYGVGAGLIIDRELYLGANGNAGAISLIQNPRHADRAGKSERPYGGATGLLYEQLRERGFSVNGPADLQQLIDSDNPQIARWIEESAVSLADAVVAAQCILDPQVILFGGRIPEPMLLKLLERISAKIPAWLASAGHQPKLMQATSGLDSATLGAAILPFYHDVVPRIEVLLKRTTAPGNGEPGSKRL